MYLTEENKILENLSTDYQDTCYSKTNVSMKDMSGILKINVVLKLLSISQEVLPFLFKCGIP